MKDSDVIKYRWHPESGVVDNEGRQVCQLYAMSLIHRGTLGRMLVKAMNENHFPDDKKKV